jgi:hypothetical protein
MDLGKIKHDAKTSKKKKGVVKQVSPEDLFAMSGA